MCSVATVRAFYGNGICCPKTESGSGSACMSSGLFKLVDGTVAAAVPVAALPVALVNAGVDLALAKALKDISAGFEARRLISHCR
jgi:hypothetical protein